MYQIKFQRRRSLYGGGGGGDFPGHKIRTVGGSLNIKYVSFEYFISMHNLNG